MAQEVYTGNVTHTGAETESAKTPNQRQRTEGQVHCRNQRTITKVPEIRKLEQRSARSHFRVVKEARKSAEAEQILQVSEGK